MTDEGVSRAGRELVPGVVVSDDTIGFVPPPDAVTLEPAGRGTDPGRRDGQRLVVELGRFLADTGRLLWQVARDPRVPWPSKLVAGGAVAYVVSPLDLIPDVIPGVGQMDDLYIVVRSLRYLARQAGYDLLKEHWTGSDDGFALLLTLAGVHR